MAYLRQLSVRIERHPEAKGNSRQFGRTWKGKPILRKSDKAIGFVNYAVLAIRAAAGGRCFDPQASLDLACDVCYPDRRHDLDVSLIMDALQESGVIDDDVQITAISAVRLKAIGSSVELSLFDCGPLPWTRKSRAARAAGRTE